MPHSLINIEDFFKNIIDKPIEILFAHEEKQIVKLFFEMLKDLVQTNKIILDSAQSGYEILDKIKTKSYDMFIIDEELPGFNVPLVFHKIKFGNPDTKIVMLAKLFNEYLNETGRVQFCKKPFRFNDLRQTLVNVSINHSLSIKNFLPIDIINTLSVIKDKSVVVIQNLENNNSGEIFIDNGKIVQASVEGDNRSLRDEKAIYKILTWKNFEGCISVGTPFPNEQDYTIAIETNYLAGLDINDLYNEKREIVDIPEEAKQKLQEYLAMVPYSMPDSFIMNAFCTLDCITHASVKDPVYNEMLYKMSDRIVEKFVTAARKINAKSITQGILSFGEDFIMAVHKLDANIWYYSILKNQDNLDTLDSIVCDFSYDAVRILSGVVKRSIEEVVEEVN